MKNKLISFISNHYVISFAVAVVIIYFLPNYFPKYKLDLVKEKFSNNIQIYYQDLNNDATAEKIAYYENSYGSTSLMIWDKNENLLGQYDFSSIIPDKGKRLSFNDSNQNGLAEIYFVTEKKDSAILNIFEPFLNVNNRKEIYIDSIGKHNNKNDLNPGHFNISNFAIDNTILFTLSSGYSGQPRNAYSYNITNNKIIKSPHLTNQSNVTHVIDLDNDGVKEVVLSNYSAGNRMDSSLTKRTDASVWLNILDENLEFKFEPIEFKSEFAGFHVEPIRHKEQFDLLCIVNSKKPSIYPSRLVKYSNKGIKLKERILAQGYYYFFIDTEKDRIINYNRINGTIQYLNNNLDLLTEQNIESNARLFKLNIDIDNEPLWILKHNNNSKLSLYQPQFKHPIHIELPTDEKGDVRIGIKQISKNKNHLFVQKGYKYFIYNYDKNPIYYLKSLVYLGLFGFILAISKLILHGYKLQEAKKKVMEEQMAELQLKTIKNQVDPHFVFNAINTISEMTLTENKLEADDFICRFSDFMRGTLEHSDKIVTTLQQELDYVENFIQLQRIRCNGCFDYKIDIEKNIDKTIKIPKHAIFTYVENAIKHGLVHRTGGLLTIKGTTINNVLTLTIENDGKGLNNAPSKKISTGNGLQIMDQIFGLYNKRFKKKTTHYVTEIVDKHDEKVGVRVEIQLFD